MRPTRRRIVTKITCVDINPLLGWNIGGIPAGGMGFGCWVSHIHLFFKAQDSCTLGVKESKITSESKVMGSPRALNLFSAVSLLYSEGVRKRSVQTTDEKRMCCLVYLYGCQDDDSPPILIAYDLKLLFTHDKQIYCAHFLLTPMAQSSTSSRLINWVSLASPVINFLNHSTNMTHARQSVLWMCWEILELEKSMIVGGDTLIKTRARRVVALTRLW